MSERGLADKVITTVPSSKTFTSAQTPRGTPAALRSVHTEFEKLWKYDFVFYLL